jgi:hypothetical protein
MFYYITENTPLPEPKDGDTALDFLGNEYKVENKKWICSKFVEHFSKLIHIIKQNWI